MRNNTIIMNIQADMRSVLITDAKLYNCCYFVKAIMSEAITDVVLTIVEIIDSL